jgi:hypothetical protein
MDELEAKLEQAWKAYSNCLADIKRIAEHGPNLADEDEILLVRGVMHLAVGEILSKGE